MVFEYADMNLTEYMKYLIKNENRRMSENELKQIMFQMLQGIHYLHSNGYLHRDLKPENFVIKLETKEVKMIDFGTVRDVNGINPPYTAYVSTRWYRSPECVLRTFFYSSSADIFAIGCVMGELFSQRPLFPGISEIDQLTRILKVMGTPKKDQWKDGWQLA